ncbi:MAG: D-tyrosyl-tRNA(Tyr) deacylase [Oscillospiraceae bacterium]|nr:D-tyrosyl-tRNA(Tyr) deacylase [Oscillospiraceae bacterium]
MKAVVTRVSSASVISDGVLTGKIEQGFLILLGVGPEDDERHAEKLAEKICSLRVFSDEEDKMNLSLDQVKGKLLVVSNFTLYGKCVKGRRPDFFGAAAPALAEKLYEHFVAKCRSLGFETQTGIFGADMKLESVNDGPVTLIIDSAELNLR